MKKSEAKQIVINADQAGQRIDNFLHRYLGDVPRSRVYQMLRKGEVRINKGRVKQTYKLHAGDQLRIPPIFAQDEKAPAKISDKAKESVLNSIIYEDSSVIVLNKPAGLTVHGGSGQRSGIIEIIRTANTGFEKLELVHRLDRDTSGCLLLAKNLQYVRYLHDAIKQGEIKKSYTALLAGRMPKSRYRVDKPLRKNTLRSGERLVEVDPQGKAAVTIFQRRQLFADATWVDIDLLTGRTHQIRVHSAWLGNPIVGDFKYGNRDINASYKKRGLKRLFLHASALQFESPATHKQITVTAPLDEQLQTIIDSIE